ncbi:MAG: TrmB family transcriptional regulator [Candidatus Nanohalobium sp.]
MEVREVLEELELTDTEIDIYMTLLRNGEATASGAAKKSGVQRRRAYDVMKALKEKGLVSYRDEENRRVYNAVSPKRLEDMIEDKKRGLEELEEKLDTAMPDLMAQFNEDAKDREVKVLEGKEGIKQLFNDELREGETIHVIGSPEESEHKLEYFLPSWTRKRQEEEIKIKGIFEHSMKGLVGDHPPIEPRFLPEDYNSRVSIAIYGEKVGIIFWVENPLVIMIRDEEAASSFMNYFEMVWESAEKE